MIDREEMQRWERQTAAMLAQAAGDDAEAFAQVVTLLDRAQALLPNIAYALRRPDSPARPAAPAGPSWSEIAAPLGVTRSAVAQRFAVARAVPLEFDQDDTPARCFRRYLSAPR